ncbi:alpha/beta fold hydrolase [Candidatus Poribacteria bacterium]|nr:alpha/beta fold hydrolase [Candidatus Poribacteria bacterium]
MFSQNLLLFILFVITMENSFAEQQLVSEMKSVIESQYIQIGDVNVHYLTAPTSVIGEEGKSSPVILIHGLGAFAETWIYNILPLSKKFCVYAPDVVGFGHSDKPDVIYSLAYFVNFLEDFMDALSIERASIVGNSMGGLIALSFALEHPERVDKLVLVDNAGFGKKVSWGLRLLTLPLIGKLLTAKTSKSGIKRGLSGSFYNSKFVTDEWVEKAYAISRLPGSKRTFLATLRSGVGILGLKREAILLDKLPQLQVPTLIVWGKEDKVISVSQAYAAFKKIPKAQLHIFEKCGHAPQVEKAEEFNRVVSEFLI